MFNGKGYNLSDIAAVTAGNRNNDGIFGGDGAWWLILLFLFAIHKSHHMIAFLNLHMLLLLQVLLNY